MHVIFIHGPAASGKHTIGTRLSALTGLPLFHNHLAVDAAKALFDFGSPGFNLMRAAVWECAFEQAAKAGRSFIFTFHPEASVAPELVERLVASIQTLGGTVHFVELVCAPETVLKRLSNPSRSEFGKLVDTKLYLNLEGQGAFEFPPLPAPLVRIDTDELGPQQAAGQIAKAVEAFNAG